MKFLIWFLCLAVASIVTTTLDSLGIYWGLIPVLVLYGAMFWLARFLCSRWDKKHLHYIEEEKDNSDN